MFIVWDIEALPHFAEDELLAAAHALVTTDGTYYGPWTVGVEVARRVCAESPHPILAAAAQHEQTHGEAVATGRMRPIYGPDSYPIEVKEAEGRLLEQQPMLELVRTWCGSASVDEWSRVTATRAEVDRLRSLAGEMIDWLKRAGHPVKAGEFRRRLQVGD